MKILHVSDLHYKESPETSEMLKEAPQQFAQLRPDLILITGDLTHDGLDEQFQTVKRFIASLDFCPVLIIPGNRDIAKTTVSIPQERSDLEYFLLTHPEPSLDELGPLENVGRVQLARQGKYLEYFPTTEIFYRANGVAVVGLNSTPEINSRSMEMAVQHFSKGQSGELRIFCAHHSFLPVPTKKLRSGDVVPRSADILQTLIELHVDFLCCGHIHRSHVWDLSDGSHRLLCCNAGSLFDISGKKDNGFLEIEIGRDLRIVKRTLFSRRTEPLYFRAQFSDVLRGRQTQSDGKDIHEVEDKGSKGKKAKKR